MKITIDTKDDSHEDIKKVIRMLQHLVGEENQSNQSNLFSDRSSLSNDSEISAFGAMFGDDSPATNLQPIPSNPIVIPPEKEDNAYEDSLELEVY